MKHFLKMHGLQPAARQFSCRGVGRLGAGCIVPGLGHNPKHNCYKQKIASPATHGCIHPSKQGFHFLGMQVDEGRLRFVSSVGFRSHKSIKPTGSQTARLPGKAMFGFRRCRG